jgi:hypothetical protein
VLDALFTSSLIGGYGLLAVLACLAVLLERHYRFPRSGETRFAGTSHTGAAMTVHGADPGPEQAGVVLPGPLGLALGFAASVAATMAYWSLGAGDSRIGLVLLTLTAAVVGVVTTLPGAIGAGALCWACYSGFVLDRFGTLTLGRGGGQALLVIVLAATAASAAAGLVRWARAVAADLASARSPSAAPATSTRRGLRN